MKDLTIIDTDILIDAARGVEEAVMYLEEKERRSTLAVSVITPLELLADCRNKSEFRDAERFMQRFRALKLDELASDKAIELFRRYRLSHGLGILDGLIAATAMACEQPLASKNQRDYAFIEGLQLLPYPQRSERAN